MRKTKEVLIDRKDLAAARISKLLQDKIKVWERIIATIDQQIDLESEFLPQKITNSCTMRIEEE